MRKWNLLLLGSLFAVAVVAGTNASVIFHKRHSQAANSEAAVDYSAAAFSGGRSTVSISFESGSQAFADSAIAAIFTHWDEKQLLDRATPRLRARLRPAQAEWLFGGLARQLGPLTGYLNPVGVACTFVPDDPVAVAPPAYEFDVLTSFRGGSAKVGLTVVMIDGRWMIDYFQITPERSDWSDDPI